MILRIYKIRSILPLAPLAQYKDYKFPADFKFFNETYRASFS